MAFVSSRQLVQWIKSELTSLCSIHILLIILNIYVFFFAQWDPLQLSNFHYMDLVSYQFVHAGKGHLFGNMMWLLMMGGVVEDKMGRFKFLLAYLFCGIASGFAFAAMEPQSILVGASGAIYGVLAMFLLSQTSIVRMLVYLIPIGFYFWSQLSNAIYDYGANTAYVGHICGFVSGLFAYTFLKKCTR